MSAYVFNDKLIHFAIDDVRVHGSIAQLRLALRSNACVEVFSQEVILSPYTLAEQAGVVYFNVRTPSEWWGRCSNTNKRVIWCKRTDKYKLFDEKDHFTASL